MVAVRLIPGAVSDSTARALVITEGAGAPTVSVGGKRASVAPCDAALRPHLGNLRLHRAHATGLKAATDHVMVAAHAGEEHRVPVRTLDSAARSLRVVVASCFYGWFGRGSHYRAALEGAYAKGAAFKLLIGDNLYVDVAPNVSEFDEGYAETVSHYLRHFWGDAYRGALSCLPTFTTWDDHELWNNFPERQCHLSRTKNPLRRTYEPAAEDCLMAFQASLNPNTPASHRSYGIEGGPVRFFVADLRSQRTRHDRKDRRMMPEEGLRALEAWARKLDRPGVLVVGQPLWLGEGSWKDFNPPDFERQYARIWTAIAEAGPEILVVSGDVHHSRLIELHLPGGKPVREFVTSPACHIPSVWSIVGGKYDVQDRGNVSLKGQVPVIDGPSPSLERYFFGTNAQNSIGVLDFDAVGDGDVSVSAWFLDLLTGLPAPSVPYTIGDRPPAGGAVCEGRDLFRLRRK